MKLVSRRSWGAVAPKNRTALSKAAQKGTALHYSGSNADESSDHKNCANRVKGIQTFHINGRGWSDIAYSYLVCKHGYTFEGRGVGIRTAANGTNAGNDAYHAVCFLGDDTANRDDVTDAGRRALRETIAMCNGWTTHANTVRPHSWFKPTACPGDELRRWISQGMPVPEKQEDVLDMDEKELLALMRRAVREEMRVLVRPDNDPSKEGSSWFDGMRRDLTTVKESVTKSE